MAGPRGKPGAKAPGARIPAMWGRTKGTVQRRPSGKGITNFKADAPPPSSHDKGMSSSPEGRAPAKATPTPTPKPRPEPVGTAKPRGAGTAKPKPTGTAKPRANAGTVKPMSNAGIAAATKALYRANRSIIGGDPNLIRTGTTLTVDGKKYKVKRGDTLWGIASRSKDRT